MRLSNFAEGNNRLISIRNGLMAIALSSLTGCFSSCKETAVTPTEQLVACNEALATAIGVYNTKKETYDEAVATLRDQYNIDAPNVSEEKLCRRHNSDFYQCRTIEGDSEVRTYRNSADMLIIDGSLDDMNDRINSCNEIKTLVNQQIESLTTSIETVQSDKEIVESYIEILRTAANND